mgnify:CR=1 FL=1
MIWKGGRKCNNSTFCLNDEWIIFKYFFLKCNRINTIFFKGDENKWLMNILVLQNTLI